MNDLPKIVRERMRTAVAGDHPDPDLLTAFAEQALPARERTPLLEHLALCADCRDVLALAAAPSGSAATQAKDTAVARKAPWFSFPVLRWGALAACLVIVGAAVLKYRDTNLSYTAKDLRQVAPSVSAPAESTRADNAPANSPSEAKAKTEADADAGASSASAAPFAPANSPKVTREKALAAGAPAPNQSYAYDLEQPAAKLPAAPPVSGANALLTKNLRDDRKMDGARSAFADGSLARIAPPPSPPAPSPAVPAPATKDAPAPGQTSNVDNFIAQANEPMAQMVDAVTADSNKSDKKVEVPGRAKTSGASASAALAVAPSDELSMQKSITPATAEAAKVRKERGQYGRVEGLRWNISSDGELQRSADSGKTWQPVPVADGVTFRALTFNGPDIWVGGAAGALYHSSDAGGHWTQVKPVANNVSLSSDIAAIAFTDPQHGKVTTTNGQTWTTNDGGQSWIQQP